MYYKIISRALIFITALFLVTSIHVHAQDSILHPGNISEAAGPPDDVTTDFVIVGDLEIFDNRSQFTGECPFLAFEDFEDTNNVPPTAVENCEPPFDSMTNNQCYLPGALIPGFSLRASDPFNNVVVVTPTAFGVTNVAVGPIANADDTVIIFTEFVNAVSMEIVTGFGNTIVFIDVFGAGDVLLGSAIKSVTTVDGTFFGVISQEQITRIEIAESGTTVGEFLYNLSFGECKQCQTTIVKSALPADDTLFEFSVENVFDFSLSDPSDTEEVILFDPGDTITVTETLPPGWQLSNVSCDITAGIIEPAPIDGGVSLECVSEGAATCTFFNNPAPRPIPTLSEWGLIAMAGVIWIIGLLALRRRRVTA